MKKTLPVLFLLAALLLTACGGEDAPATTPKGSGGSGGSNVRTTAPASKNVTTPAPAGTSGVQTTGGTDGTDGTGSTGGDPSEPLFTADDASVFIAKGTADIDGVKDESWNNAQSVTLDQVKKDSPSPDTVVKASAMWDENAIYFLFEITDAQIFSGGSAGDYNNDGIYLYISEDPNAFVSKFEEYGYGVYQFALISKELEMLPRYGADSGEDLKAETAYSATDDGMIIEFKYTFSYAEYKDGTFILLDYQYNDCESSGKRMGAMSWYNGTDGDASTMGMAIAMLVDTLPEGVK